MRRGTGWRGGREIVDSESESVAEEEGGYGEEGREGGWTVGETGCLAEAAVEGLMSWVGEG